MSEENLTDIVQVKSHTKDNKQRKTNSTVSDEGSYYPGQEIEGRYGWSPEWIQCCNNPSGFLVIISFFLISQGKTSILHIM